jgi:clan AA aspartic protease (TIGR02281 family)
MVDTGATLTTMNDDMLKQLKLPYKVVNDRVPLHTADGRVASARQIAIESMNVGPFELHNMQVFICPNCASLLGQNSLSQFNLRSSRNQGVEFLTFEPRAAH